ncbi:MAG: 5-(carboxyamino)imidazole ribonucleotide mutase [Gammaproteobacteria bacterium]|nr:5-(carboxyamino)imidazole ribonucleotide mutase [Gammaproteobacteria bacterium]
MTGTRFVAILCGSTSDLATMQATVAVLDRFGIVNELQVRSAHRTPEATREYVRDAERRGCAVFIAAAGLAAHLAGAIAAQTTRPVIGVPLDAGPLHGFDALLSTVQMPGGIPVATVAIGKAGATNAGYLAAQIMALVEPGLAERLAGDRTQQATNILSQTISN